VLLHLVRLLNEISSHLLLMTCCHFVGCSAWRAVVGITLRLLSITLRLLSITLRLLSITLRLLRRRVTHGAEATRRRRGRAKRRR